MAKGKIGNKLFNIRKRLGQLQGKSKLTLRQLEALFNATKPLTVTTTWQDIWKYENDAAEPPGKKWDKFLELDPNFNK